MKIAVSSTARFEELLSEEAGRYDADGVICGHIHHEALHDRFGTRYVNTGDWVESCTGVVEHYDGRLEVVHWADRVRSRADGQAAATVPFEPKAA